jgi:hypothetical protein
MQSQARLSLVTGWRRSERAMRASRSLCEAVSELMTELGETNRVELVDGSGS